MLVNLTIGEVGNRIVPGLPVSFSAMDPDYRRAPLIGEHTDEVLSESRIQRGGNRATERRESDNLRNLTRGPFSREVEQSPGRGAVTIL